MNYLNLGLYIHIPFCYSKCPYCGFFSIVDNSESNREKYINAIKKEIHIYGKKYPGIAVQSIYIGGGTPTVFSGKVISTILATCYQTFRINKDIEISIESNPATFDTVKAETILKSGINRLSIGAQSFNNRLLQNIGRIHDKQDIIRSYNIARNVGFKNINIDLMFGIPGQTVRNFQTTLEEVIKLHPEHISVYGLTIEEGTPFQKYIEQGILTTPSDDIAYTMYQKAINFLYCCGYEQYEISNFALPGKRCFHNQIYWKNKEYLGIGASSTSYIKKIRFKNISNLNQYIHLLKNNILPVESKEVLPLREQISETVILKLRMTEGIAKDEFMARFNTPIETVFYEQLETLKKEGLLQENKSHYYLTKKGIALSNIASMKFLT